MAFISEFTSDIRHIHGESNSVADALSRNVSAIVQAPVELEALASAQLDDQEIRQLSSTDTSLQLEHLPIPNSPRTVLCDTSQGTPRPIVPSIMRHNIYNQLHSLSHPGIKASWHLVSQRYVWPNMKRDIAQWTRACHACQQSKVHRHVKAPFQSFPAPAARFDSLHVDIVGPLPPSQGYTYLFTCVDRYTRWPEAIPMADATADSCARALLSGWVSRFGVPLTIISDQGSQFESDLWRELMHLLGTTRHRTTAYHPQANGLVERFHRSFKDRLRARLAGANWVSDLPIVLLGIRTSLKEDLSCTAAEMVYGSTLRLPGDFFFAPTPMDPSFFVSKLRHTMQSQQFIATGSHGSPKSYVPRDLHRASHVYVRRDAYRRPLTRPYTGPFQFLSRTNKHFTVLIDGQSKEISVDRLKPARLDIASYQETTQHNQLPQLPAANTTPLLHQQPTTTNSGRVIRQPARFADYASDW